MTPFGSAPYGDVVEAAGLAAVVAAVTTASAFYAEMRQVASDLLADFRTGSVVLVKRVRTLTDNPLAPFAATETRIARNAYVGGFADMLVDGARIVGDDQRVILDAKGLAAKPSVEDRLVIDDVDHTIVSVKAIPAAGAAALYILQARSH